MKYRKKPVVIEAVQFNGWNHEEIAAFVGDSLIHHKAMGGAADGSEAKQLYEKLEIKTLEGNHQVSTHDFIIKGVKGEFYPCKPDIFRATYDIVQQVSPPTTGR